MGRLSESIRVLYVDDDVDFAESTAEVLNRGEDGLTVETATEATEALDTFTAAEFDCIVSDYSMPGRDGLELLEQIRDEDEDIPFILFTGRGSEDVASDAFAAGATDYVKTSGQVEQFDLLRHRIENAVEQYRATQRASELARIRALVRDVNQALVRAKSRQAVEKDVCNLFTEAGPYVFAWIGVHDPETQTVEPRVGDGVDEGYLDVIEITTDGASTGQGPTAKAIQTREITVTQNIPDQPGYDEWREEALRRGYRSSAAVPLVMSI